MKKLFLFLLLPLSLHAACTGSSPNWTAASANGIDIISCLPSASSWTSSTGTVTNGQNAAFVAGDTVNVPAGAVTWSGSSQLKIASTKVNLVGATACATGCSAGSGTGGTYLDNSGTCLLVGTCITLADSSAAAFLISGSSPTNFTTVSGFTFICNTVTAATVGCLQVNGARSPSGSFRLHHNHLRMGAPGGAVLVSFGGFGLLDHIFFEDTLASGTASSPMQIFGTTADQGYTAWNEPTHLGSAEALYLEDFTYTSTVRSSEGLIDFLTGAKIVIRHGTISGNELGGNHGYDSGGDRSGAVLEVYNVAFTNTGSIMELYESRGGTTLNFSNTYSGTWGNINLHYYRNTPITSGQAAEFALFGAAKPGLNWIPLSATPTTGNTLGPGPAWQGGSHVYAANSAITTGTCNLWTSAGGTSSSGSTAPTCPGNGNTVSDGSVSWLQVGGSVSAGLTTHGWCAANPDTIASSDATCAALSAGDTASRYTDANGGVCPFRDQPGVGHNQAYMPDYEWLNTSGATWSQADGEACVTPNSAFYSYTTSFTGVSGVGSGLLSARPATCIPQVAYWATDTSTLYQCSATNAWIVYYAPLAYPHPLAGGLVPAASPTFSPGTGTYGTIQVTISTTSSGAIICYNTTGSPATNGGTGCTTGTRYSGPVTVSVSETLFAVAGGTGFSDSSVASAVYTVPAAQSPSMFASVPFSTGVNVCPQPKIGQSTVCLIGSGFTCSLNGLAYSPTECISIPPPPVLSVNGQIGHVVLGATTTIK